MNTAFKRMWKEVIVAYFKVLYRHLLRGTGEIHGKLYS
jgi:hypothetical protein